MYLVRFAAMLTAVVLIVIQRDVDGSFLIDGHLGLRMAVWGLMAGLLLDLAALVREIRNA